MVGPVDHSGQDCRLAPEDLLTVRCNRPQTLSKVGQIGPSLLRAHVVEEVADVLDFPDAHVPGQLGLLVEPGGVGIVGWFLVRRLNCISHKRIVPRLPAWRKEARSNLDERPGRSTTELLDVSQANLRGRIPL